MINPRFKVKRLFHAMLADKAVHAAHGCIHSPVKNSWSIRKFLLAASFIEVFSLEMAW